jgi:hypothetical protein
LSVVLEVDAVPFSEELFERLEGELPVDVELVLCVVAFVEAVSPLAFLFL